ncbi:type VI secretion system protein TssA [Paraburkholderia bannensis]|uniref:type VI secretion system protein TssA n=1 Tax=Paraburkholderia bannensis TaxID=765414 RepID=UPI0004890077|nr:type VI secretion system ImpA family N-terminal domain-containing protein [Paraburkholderia bannensis]
MSREKRKDTQKTVTSPLTHDWMVPVEDALPCGKDLEYDPEFVVLGAALATRADAQYGDFVGAPDPVSWTDVERDCRRLMMRSKDMRLAILYTRCCTRTRAAAGLAEGLALLVAWLEAWPEKIHPQPDVDEDRDAALEIRMNALQSLTDTDGLLADLREIALARSTATRLQVRDVERAFAHPRAADALAPESVTRQLEELHAQQPSRVNGFDDAARSVVAIDAWCHVHLGAYIPDLSALTRLLAPLVTAVNAVSTVATPDELAMEPAMPMEENETQESREPDSVDAAVRALALREDVAPATIPPAAEPMDRHAALGLIQQARAWFERHEPSSPIPVLLRRAEQFVGKPYVEVIKAIPADLLVQWEGGR